jgi:hypothetical protein
MGAPGQQQPQDIAQIVPGVGDEGDRVRQHAENDLRDHERDVEHGRDGEGSAEIRRRVAVAVIVVAGVVPVMMVVVIVVVIMVRMIMIEVRV